MRLLRSVRGLLALFLFSSLQFPFAENLSSWKEIPEGRYAPLSISNTHKNEHGFLTHDSNRTGILFSNHLSETTSLTNSVINNGSGLAIGDVNQDGLPDLYLCRLEGPNQLLLNKGNHFFQDFTSRENTSLQCSNQWSTGATFADVDGDHDLDLLVNGIAAGTRLFLNDGKAVFRESHNSGLNTKLSATSLSLADGDGDGDLDLYVCHYRTTTLLDMPGLRLSLAQKNGQWTVTRINGSTQIPSDWENRFLTAPDGSPKEAGEPDLYYENQGNGRFTRTPITPPTFISSKPPPPGWGLAVQFRDINHDGWPDIYVCNDADSPDTLWLNQKNGTFKLATSPTLPRISLSSMGIDFSDINKDGFDDFFVADMLSASHEHIHTQLIQAKPITPQSVALNDTPSQYNQNSLYINRGDHTFTELAWFAGVAASDWSWTPLFLDVDLDGHEDLLISNGFHRDVRDYDASKKIESLKRQQRLSPHQELLLRKEYPPFETPNIAFRNNQNLRFDPYSKNWGFDHIGISQGMAYADMDQDGDQDIIANNLNAPLLYLENKSAAPRIIITLKGAPPNTQAIGSTLTLRGQSISSQRKVIISGGRYLSGGDTSVTFAAPDPSMTLEIQWPNRLHSTLDNLRPNRHYHIDQSKINSIPNRKRRRSPPQPLFYRVNTNFKGKPKFKDSTHLSPFDRISLPPQESVSGWLDLNLDGREDIILGGAKNAPLNFYLNTPQQTFSQVRIPQWSTPLLSHQQSFCAWAEDGTTINLLSGGPTPTKENNFFLTQWNLWLGQPSKDAVLPNLSAPPSSLNMADIDRDGDLDLLVCFAAKDGNFFNPPSPQIYKKNKGKFVFDKALSAPLEKISLLQACLWSDLNQDSWPDLILAPHLGRIRILMNRNGRLIDESEVLGKENIIGPWLSLETGDWNGDGLPDIIAGNLGHNHPFQSKTSQELFILHGDWNKDNIIETIEGHQDLETQQLLPLTTLTTFHEKFPWTRQTFSSAASFAKADLKTILEPYWDQFQKLPVQTFSSTLWLQTSTGWQNHPLPKEIQWSPAMSLHNVDLNGDGHQDLFICQNNRGSKNLAPPHRTQLGLCLLGDGTGNLTPLAPREAGIKSYKDQIGAAFADYNLDGRIDLLLSHKDGSSWLYENKAAEPAIKVHLKGPPQNYWAIGATVRLEFEGNKLGPVQELRIHDGKGNLSSPRKILGYKTFPAAIHVKWPNGKPTRVAIKPRTNVLTISYSEN